jgi:hypothetical protein
MVKSKAKEIFLSGENLKKLRVINDCINKLITGSEGAEKLDITTKQVTRLKQKVLKGGSENIIHGLSGKTSNNKTPEIVNIAVEIGKSIKI